MGTTQSVQSVRKVSFEDIIDTVFTNQNSCLLVNTLPFTDQECLISHTIPAAAEESVINTNITQNIDIPIILYGRNTGDHSVLIKYEQLNKLGFRYVYIYPGGIFEWLLLQEIYGSENFPTTIKVKDLYRYRPDKTLQMRLLRSG